jgi:PAT family beta-lactamase induction signal transducer AmpG
LRTRLAWVAVLSFASGVPYGLFTDLVPVLLRSYGVGLAQLGFLSLASLPWALKFLWAPAVDRLGTRRQWIAGSQLGLAALLLLLALSDVSVAPGYVALIFVLVALSATQDIAVDAYTIELMERRELGPANGTRVTAYRIGWIFAGGLLVAASARLGWTGVLLLAAALFLALSAVNVLLPRTSIEREPHQPLLEPLRELLTRPAIWVAVLFTLTFKLGDLALAPMVKPFWVDSGYSVEQIGWVQTTLGVAASIVGALVGGVVTRWIGAFHALWVLGLVQALSNLTYWGAAVAGAPTGLMYTAAVVEQFTQGLGTAAFLTFLMTLCERRYAATQFALLTALYRIGGILAGTVSGEMTERMGYADYFLFTFGLALPAFALLPWIRRSFARE